MQALRTSPQGFPSTRWTRIVRSHGRTDREPCPEAEDAFAELCQIYWYPVYAYIRWLGYPAQDAEDYAQAYFLRLLSGRDIFAEADPAKGRFRQFLAASVKAFVFSQRRKALAQKRGGDRVIVSFDAALAESLFDREPSQGLSPEALFERRMAVTLLESVQQELADDYQRRGKSHVYEALKNHISWRSGDGAQAELAERMGTSVAALRMALHRLRQRYGEILRERVADLVEGPEEVEDELRYLSRLFQGAAA